MDKKSDGYAQVDVLAVMDRLIGNARVMTGLSGDPILRENLRDGEKARAAVAALIAERDALRAALKEVEDCSEYWSEYFVPIGLPDRIRAALATGESA